MRTNDLLEEVISLLTKIDGRLAALPTSSALEPDSAPPVPLSEPPAWPSAPGERRTKAELDAEIADLLRADVAAGPDNDSLVRRGLDDRRRDVVDRLRALCKVVPTAPAPKPPVPPGGMSTQTYRGEMLNIWNDDAALCATLDRAANLGARWALTNGKMPPKIDY